ncbi:MAG: fumarate hydratase [Phascolarctobacterium faecium]
MREIKFGDNCCCHKLCKDSCYYLPEELLEKLKASIATEESPLGQEILTTIVENART